MTDPFAFCDDLNIRDHGDAREKELWPAVAVALSQYELFWRNLIVLLTNRIDPNISAEHPEWIRLRSSIPRVYEQLAMHNYSLFYYAAAARCAIDEDHQRLTSGKYPRPECVFFALEGVSQNAERTQQIARNILCGLDVRWKFPKHPKPLYETIGLYRNAFSHDPLLGRAIEHGRELLPPPERLPKKGRPLLWRDIAEIPNGEMVDGLRLENQLWQQLASFLQDQWISLTKAFLQARQLSKFVADLGLASFLPIRRPPSVVSLAGPVAASGAIIARSDAK
jgi:hypothetical protein